MSDGRKDDNGKPRISLLDIPFILEMVGVLMHGAAKYDEGEGGEPNFIKVANARRRYFDAAARHLLDWFRGEQRDAEGLHHLACVAVNAMFLYVVERRNAS